MTAPNRVTRATVTDAVRMAEKDAAEFAERATLTFTERNSYAYAYLLGCLKALGVDVDAIRDEAGVAA